MSVHSAKPSAPPCRLPQKQVVAQKQRVQRQLQELCQFLEQQEQLFVTWLEDLGDAISQAGETYGTRVSGDIASLDELIWDLEARQCQSMWMLMQVCLGLLPRLWVVAVSLAKPAAEALGHEGGDP